MAKRKTHAKDSQRKQHQDAPSSMADKLTEAKEKLARMEETHKLCFHHQNNLFILADELQKRGYGEFEITYLLEPKAPRNIPGYQRSEIERQKQFINYLTARAKPADSHTEAVQQPPADQAQSID